MGVRILAVVLVSTTLTTKVSAQLQLAMIDGVVTAFDDRPVGGATVTLLDRLGNAVRSTSSASDGTFRIADVQPGSYSMRADASPFHAELRDLQVGGSLAVRITLRMSALTSEQVLVRAAPDTESGATSTRVTIGGASLTDAASRVRTRGLQDLIATVPGWSSEDNGLLHVRGVDEGVLYVIDGIPAYERLDGLFGVAPDPMTLDSITVSTGYIPPEFGFKSGAVVEVRSAAAPATRWTGTAELGIASEQTGDGAVLASGPVSTTGSVALNATTQRSDRFLDPTDPDNFHNTGNSLTGGVEYGWHVTPSAVLRAVAGAGRSHFQVPHNQEQDDAGQDQRQHVSSSWQSVSWQRVWSAATLSHLATYHRTSGLTVTGTDADTPLVVDADRTSRRVGILLSASHSRGGHLFKVGAEAARLHLDEAFSFAVVDPAAEDFTPGVLSFTPARPFVFKDEAAPSLLSVYAQDSFRPTDSLSIDLGLRADWSHMLVAASQVSPRVGTAYRLGRSGTTLRASFGRFFQPPQPEYLLLASSPAAGALSPFAVGDVAGTAPLLPERQTAVELAIDQMLGRFVRLDVAYWRRWTRNAADPNVFLGTTIIFPNSVARGWASGIDVRLDLPKRGGWSAFASYSNSRVEQAGPITGGLFLEDDVQDIAKGERFTPDHDQRNVGSAGVSFSSRRFRAAAQMRFESGTPLQLGHDELTDLRSRPGVELVDFERGRVKPRRSVDVELSHHILERNRTGLAVRIALLNATGARWAYNFGNPFSGTHFGPARTLHVGFRTSFR